MAHHAPTGTVENAGGYFLIKSKADALPDFPVAFSDPVFGDALQPGASATVGAVLDNLTLFILYDMGYQELRPSELSFAAQAFATLAQ